LGLQVSLTAEWPVAAFSPVGTAGGAVSRTASGATVDVAWEQPVVVRAAARIPISKSMIVVDFIILSFLLQLAKELRGKRLRLLSEEPLTGVRGSF